VRWVSESDGGGGVTLQWILYAEICFGAALFVLSMSAVVCLLLRDTARSVGRLAAYHWTPLPVPVARPGEVVPAEPGGKEVAA